MSQHEPESLNVPQQPIIREGHTAAVKSVTFSPDGRRLVSGSKDHSVRIWDAESPHTPCQLLTGHTGPVTSVSYSPLGDTIASSSEADRGVIRLWDVKTSHQIGEFMWRTSHGVNSVAFSPDAKLIVSDYDNTGSIRFWDVESRTAVSRPLKKHVTEVLSVSFSPDGTRVVSGSHDWTICIWDVERCKTVVGPLEEHTFCVSSVCYSPNGSQIASSSYDHTVRLWDARTGAMICKFEGHTDEVYSVSFSPNGRYVASGGYDKTIRLWDIRAGRQVDEPLQQHTDWVTSLAFSPDGTSIASGSYDKTVMMWNLSGRGLDMENDPQRMIGEDAEGSQHGDDSASSEDDMDVVGQHMSIDQLFERLVRHGCDNLAPRMDENQDTAVLMSGGGYGDIWKGKLGSGVSVAIKAWRASLVEGCDYKSLKRATREIHHWSKMKHENVHQLMGVIMFKGQALGMVSEWMENGNLHEYLRKNPEVDRYQLSLQVASGLAYVHNCEMVHGDIKAINVLISSDGVAKLTDFGLSTMAESSLEFSATSSLQVGSTRWAAPELLLEELPKSNQSDVYALGMTILEIFTGTVPYSDIQWDYQLIRIIDQGKLPDRPAEQLRDNQRDDWLWGVLVKCWDREPDARPSAQEVAERISSILPLAFK